MSRRSMATSGTPEYQKLMPDTPDLSVTGGREVNSPPLPHQLHLPTKAPTVRYVPSSGWSRYRSAVRSLVPFRRTCSYAQELPVDKVGLFSNATFNWLGSTLGQIDECNLPKCSPLDSCDINGQRLHCMWRDEVVRMGQRGSSLFTVMWRFVKIRVMTAVFIYILGLAFSIQGPVIFLQHFLHDLNGTGNICDHNNTNETINADGSSGFTDKKAVMWAMGLIFTELVSVLLIAWSWSIICRTATRLRSASIALIYNKLLCLSKLNTISTQQMVTLLGTDGQKLYEAVLYGSYIITAPVVFLFCIASCIYILSSNNFHTLITLPIFLVIYPLLCALVRLACLLNARATALCTQRLKLVYELLVNIKLVKLTSWESVLSQNITGARHREVGFIRMQYLCDGICTSVTKIIPVVALVVFLYSKTDTCFEAYKVFPVLALFFGHMKDSLYKFWLGVKKVSDVFPSLKRFKSVMLLNEVDKFTEKPINRLIAVNILNASFVWDNTDVQQKGQKKKSQPRSRSLRMSMEMDELAAEVDPQVKPTLVDITFVAPKGKLIGICGESKCGKTSLLLAMLGHLHEICGQVFRDGNFAYVGERPWIWTASVRENILFKEPFHHKRYYNAVHSCSLNEDIDKLPRHDDTQIDDMRLSAGQKQRIALARALYSNRDIYLLDNPLSMVDADMAATIFNKCILNALHARTVILATQHIQFMTRCDELYVMRHGKIVKSGTHEQLMQHCPLYSSLLRTFTNENSKKYFIETSGHYEHTSSETALIRQNNGHTDGTTSVRSCEVDGEDTYHLDNVDLDSTGPVSIYRVYLGSLSSHVWIVCGLLSQLLYNMFMVGIPLIMFYYKHHHDLTESQQTSLNVILVMLMCFSGFFWIFSFTRIAVGVSQRMHDLWFEKLCRAPLGYFQTSPAMMFVLNLFSLNVQDIDMRLPVSLQQLLENSSFFLCATFVLACILPYSLAVIFLGLLVSGFLGWSHRKNLLKLHETEVISRIPLRQHLVTTITGRTTIQAFAKDKDFIEDFTKKCDDNATCMYLLSVASCWLAVRMQAIAAVLIGLVAVMLTFPTPVLLLGGLPCDWIAGLVLVITMQIGGCLQHTMQSMAESEARLEMFAESNRCIQGLRSEGQTIQTKHKLLPVNWPTDNSITFQDVKTAVSPGSSQVLDGMSFKIETGKKIGVVGLPDSGKKLLVDTLFKLVDVKHGKILIGGTDLTCVPLEKLRSIMAIVPQDPVLFTGNIRLNIDPHKLHSDSEVWESLQKVNLRECIESLPHQLDTPVDRNGVKLSVGERQLLYLARAYLRNTKVLVLEEPLATVGGLVDATLNDMALTLFPNATVLTIAHQIKYVMQCHKIMVVVTGKVVEFDTPLNLYRNQNSYFSQMASEFMDTLSETEL